VTDSLAWQDDELARSLTHAVNKNRAVEASLYGRLTTEYDDGEHEITGRAVDPLQGHGGHEMPIARDDLELGLSRALHLPPPRRYGA